MISANLVNTQIHTDSFRLVTGQLS